jgi:hypothetical protein
MSRSRRAPCTARHARTRLDQAQQYLDIAELVLSDETGSEATVATGNAVLAGIAPADAICCSGAGSRYRESDHREAADYLERVTGDRTLAKALRDLADYKDQAHYGLTNVRVNRAKAAIRRARRSSMPLVTECNTTPVDEDSHFLANLNEQFLGIRSSSLPR